MSLSILVTSLVEKSDEMFSESRLLRSADAILLLSVISRLFQHQLDQTHQKPNTVRRVVRSRAKATCMRSHKSSKPYLALTLKHSYLLISEILLFLWCFFGLVSRRWTEFRFRLSHSCIVGWCFFCCAVW